MLTKQPFNFVLSEHPFCSWMKTTCCFVCVFFFQLKNPSFSHKLNSDYKKQSWIIYYNINFKFTAVKSQVFFTWTSQSCSFWRRPWYVSSHFFQYFWNLVFCRLLWGGKVRRSGMEMCKMCATKHWSCKSLTFASETN